MWSTCITTVLADLYIIKNGQDIQNPALECNFCSYTYTAFKGLSYTVLLISWNSAFWHVNFLWSSSDPRYNEVPLYYNIRVFLNTSSYIVHKRQHQIRDTVNVECSSIIICSWMIHDIFTKNANSTWMISRKANFYKNVHIHYGFYKVSKMSYITRLMHWWNII